MIVIKLRTKDNFFFLFHAWASYKIIKTHKYIIHGIYTHTHTHIPGKLLWIG